MKLVASLPLWASECLCMKCWFEALMAQLCFLLAHECVHSQSTTMQSVFSWPSLNISHLSQCLSQIHASLLFELIFNGIIINRPRVPLHSEKGTTSPTRLAVAAAKFRTTSKRRHALAVDTQRKRWGILTGEKRLRVKELSVLDAWDTWRLLLEGSRMDLGSKLQQRKWLPAKSKSMIRVIIYTNVVFWSPFLPFFIFSLHILVCWLSCTEFECLLQAGMASAKTTPPDGVGNNNDGQMADGWLGPSYGHCQAL